MYHAICRLRTLRAVLREEAALDDQTAEWAWTGLSRFLDRRSATLDEAFELKAPPGGVPWWREEAIRERDEALRAIATIECAAASASQRARRVDALVRRYALGSWPVDAAAGVMPEGYRGSAREHLWRAFQSGAPLPLGDRQMRTILSG
jgi:hypothetical protein